MLRRWTSRIVGRSELVGEALVDAARERTGLSDLGDPAEWAPGFAALMDSAQRVPADALGSRIQSRSITGSLANRLRFVAARNGPRTPVQRPIVIAAPPRTGSTMLLALLGAGSGVQALPLWKAMRPFHPRGARIEAKVVSRMVQWGAPDQMTKHPVLADGLVEDSWLQMGTFCSVQWWATMPVHGYLRWLLNADVRPAYRVLRDHLELLGGSGRWVLKSPGHFLHLGALLETFPDALVVMIHRDPARIVASTHSLLTSGHAIVAPGAPEAELHASNAVGLARGAEHVVAVRKGSDARFFDVGYRELVADPLGVALRIRARAGLESDEACRSAMDAALRTQRPDRFGTHRYSGTVCGEPPERIRERFAGYLGRFSPELGW